MLEPAQKYDAKVKLRLIPDIIPGWKTIVTLVSITVLFGFSIWWLNKNPALQGLWNNFIMDKRAPASFCEQIHINNPIRQPINTFSNIVYIIIAVIILGDTWRDRSDNIDNRISESKVFPTLFAVVLLYVFAASAFYHASLIGIAHTLDYSAVFSFSLFPVMFFIYHWRFLTRRISPGNQKRNTDILFLTIFFGINLALIFLTPKNKEPVIAMILVSLFLVSGITNLLTWNQKPGSRYLLYSILSVGVAIVWFEFDKNKIACNPKSFFQPHSLWNIFISISAFWFYLYMRMEKSRVPLIVKLEQ